MGERMTQYPTEEMAEEIRAFALGEPTARQKLLDALAKARGEA